jgi:hypothetical protein
MFVTLNSSTRVGHRRSIQPYLHPVFAAAVSEGAGINAAYLVGVVNGVISPVLQATTNELFPNIFSPF